MASEIEKLKIYVRIKWFIIFITFLTITLESLLGVMGWTATVSAYAGVALISFFNFLLQIWIKRGAVPPMVPYLYLASDLLIIEITLYFNGGPENTWWFLPVFAVFIAGYIYNLRTALIYGALATLGVGLIFSLEYFNLVPHFSIYGLGVFQWKDREFIIDYFLGMFLLYTGGALASGYFNMALGESSRKLEESKRALLNLMGDLEDRVRQRTAELEEVRQGLEARVKERTADLELNRRAIMHMLKDLKKDVEKLRVVDKMKDEFLSIISHELRTPMTPLLDYLNMLNEGLAGDFSIEQRKMFQAMHRSARRELNLIDSLLDFSRLERGLFAPHKTRFSIKNLVHDLIENAQLGAKESGIEIKFGEFAEVEAEADENQISRVIAQLFDNAIKFSSRGGAIEVFAQKSDHEIRITIKDGGIGLAKENLEKIFDKFYQVDSGYTREKGGMGLGLAICREIIKAHGGRIWAESAGLGQGSTFCFSLPLTPVSS